MSKFGNLNATTVDKPFRVEIIDPTTEEVVTDLAGLPMYIDVWSTDSPQARNYDKAKRAELRLKAKQSRNGQAPVEDAVETAWVKLAQLTAAWRLVDRLTGEELDVECTPDNALELYSEKGMAWLYNQVLLAASDPANFMQKPARRSATTPPSSTEGK